MKLFLAVAVLFQITTLTAAWAGPSCAETDICYLSEANNGEGIAIEAHTLEWYIEVSTDLHGKVKLIGYTGREDSATNSWAVEGSVDYKQMQSNRAGALKTALELANSLKAAGVCAAVVDNSDSN